MVKFEPVKKNPGDLIRSEDWNKIQEDMKDDLDRLEDELTTLRSYIDSLAKSVTLTNLDSPLGTSYRLDEDVPGAVGNYSTSVLGYITRQWVLGREATGDMCKFGVLDFFDLLYYWSGADGSEKGCLEITLEYVDGTVYTAGELMINNWTQLQLKNEQNPYFEYLLSPNERVWYKYAIRNPSPDKEVRYVSFKDIDDENVPRIANVIQHIARIRPV